MILRPLPNMIPCQKVEHSLRDGVGRNRCVPFVANGLPGVIAFAPSGRLGGFFLEPCFELLGSHVDELIELPTAELARLRVHGGFQWLAYSMTVLLSLTMLGKCEI